MPSITFSNINQSSTMNSLQLPEPGQSKEVAQAFILHFIPTIDHHKTKYLVEKARIELAGQWSRGTTELYTLKLMHFVLQLGEYHGEVIFHALQEAIRARDKRLQQTEPVSFPQSR
jgi:hypothetical protein